MFALFYEALGYKFKKDLKYRITRLLMFDIWLYCFVVYGLVKWGFAS